MLKFPLIPMLALLSFSAFAEVSFEEKKSRVEFLEDLAKDAVSMNIEAYRRELQYEQQELPLEKRAENEANLVAEKIKVQVQRAYEAALETKSPEEASSEIRNAIEKDLELVAPELRDEIEKLSFEALENAEKGYSGSEVNLESLEKKMLKNVKERAEFLNEEGEVIEMVSAIKKGNPVTPSANSNRDAEKKTYISKEQLLESLTSDRESTRWVSTSNMSVRGDQVTRADSRISVQLKVDFLGVALEAGPTITFKREFKTTVVVSGEGLQPVLLPDGNFDFTKRDREGKVVRAGGKVVKRFFNFTCEAALDFESDYTGGGGFSVAGVGGGTSVTKTYSNSVTLTSRRVVVPEFIDNTSTTIRYLNQLCHRDFLKAKITNTMTVEGSLNLMMRNVLAGVKFSHPKTQCVTDSHCSKWMNTQVLAIARVGNTARCVQNAKEKYSTCELRGQRGQSCPVYDSKGKLLSDGKFEYACDAGLKCVKVQQEGWLQGWSLYQYAKGKCR